jgi:hypothetical protein
MGRLNKMFGTAQTPSRWYANRNGPAEICKMTCHEDPNMPYRPIPRDETSYTGWAVGVLAVLMLASAVIFIVNGDDGTQTATNNTNRPAATQPASPPANPPSTTGSGTTAPAPANR